MTHTIPKVNEFKEDFLTEKISLAEGEVQEYLQVIENEKQQFLIYSQQQQYAQCHIETMLNSIDRRRRTLTERVQLMNDFSTMLADENYDDDDDDSDVEEIYGNID